MASGSDKTPEVFYPVMNDHGDVMALLDATGSNIVARYEYDPWGNVLSATGSAADICPFRWQTKYFDNETRLYYFGYRFFDSLTGRWLSRDPIAENGGVNLYAFYGNDPVNGVDGLGLWWWDAELIEDGLGGLLGFYGLENTRACWQGSGMLSVESAAIYFNELSFGLLDSSGLTFTHEYKTAEHQAARGVGRITRTVEVGLASQGALSTTYASLAVAGGKTALYGTTAVRAGVTALALNSANQNSGSAVDAYAAGHTGGAIGYSILSVWDMYSAANLMWQSRPVVDVPSQKCGPYVDQKVRGASSGSATTATAPNSTTAVQKFYPGNDGFLGQPQRQLLEKGTLIDRYGGSEVSRYFSPSGTPAAARALPPGSVGKPLRTFEVLKPFEVEAGTVAPAFDQIGLGIQYKAPIDLKILLKRGIIREIMQ